MICRSLNYSVPLPSEECRDCTFRMLRQAREWGNTYLFWSCADIDILSGQFCYPTSERAGERASVRAREKEREREGGGEREEGQGGGGGVRTESHVPQAKEIPTFSGLVLTLTFPLMEERERGGGGLCLVSVWIAPNVPQNHLKMTKITM